METLGGLLLIILGATFVIWLFSIMAYTIFCVWQDIVRELRR